MIIGDMDPSARAEREVRGLFADEAALERAVDWARTVLSEAGVDASSQQLRAMRELRRVERRLSLVGARYLVSAVTGRPPQRPGRRSPLLR